MEEEEKLTIESIPKKEPKEEIRSTSPTASLEVAQLKKEIRSLHYENDSLCKEVETCRENIHIANNAFQSLRKHLQAVVDKYMIDQGQSEMELQGLDKQAKQIIERIQIVANKLEEDNALLVEKLREAIK